jgi:hypothetical protein
MQSAAAANKDAEQPDETAILLQAASVLIHAASKRVFVAKDYDVRVGLTSRYQAHADAVSARHRARRRTSAL